MPKLTLSEPKNGEKETQLHEAASTGNTALIKQLIEGGSDINGLDEHGRTPLICASASGQLDAVKTLVRFKADKSIKDFGGNTANSTARHFGDFKGAIVKPFDKIVKITKHE